MKEKLAVPTGLQGQLWLYDRQHLLGELSQFFLHHCNELGFNLVTVGGEPA